MKNFFPTHCSHQCTFVQKSQYLNWPNKLANKIDVTFLGLLKTKSFASKGNFYLHFNFDFLLNYGNFLERKCVDVWSMRDEAGAS